MSEQASRVLKNQRRVQSIHATVSALVEQVLPKQVVAVPLQPPRS